MAKVQKTTTIEPGDSKPDVRIGWESALLFPVVAQPHLVPTTTFGKRRQGIKGISFLCGII
jgi:hypothetical protein